MSTHLYNVPRNTFIKVLQDYEGPPGARNIKAGETLLFRNIDGMYSRCMDMEQNTVYLKAWAEVEISEFNKK
jgi:hypothetical protein